MKVRISYYCLLIMRKRVIIKRLLFRVIETVFTGRVRIIAIVRVVVSAKVRSFDNHRTNTHYNEGGPSCNRHRKDFSASWSFVNADDSTPNTFFVCSRNRIMILNLSPSSIFDIDCDLFCLD